jgi:hypothetical protein
MTKIPPALIIAYKRNQNVIELIETLIQAGVPRIYIAIDGQRDSEILSSQPSLSSLLEVFNSNGAVQLSIWERKSNLGPAVSVVTAIEWFFTNEEFGMIFEDDLRITSESVRYFTEALSTFAQAKSIGIISGSNFWGDLGSQNSLPFATYPLTWGWATWRDRWNLLRKPFYENSKIDLRSLPVVERFFWKNGVENCMDRRFDAWDIPFAANFKSLRLRAVIPHQNFVTNVGFDAYAGNTFENVWPLNMPIAGKNLTGEILAISDSKDITQRIIRDIYRISYRSVIARPLRLIQHLMKFRKSDSLNEIVKSVDIPGFMP